MKGEISKCPLCSNRNSFILHRDTLGRKLLECPECRLVFTEYSHRPDPVAEKIRYLQHNNSLENKEYMDYIESKLNRLLHLADKEAKFCDYGSGPVNALNHILSSRGFFCHSYDPYFNPELPTEKVDFIIAIESAEHFFNVHEEFSRMTGMIQNKGMIGVFTSLWDQDTDFKSWHYTRDITHVSFYSMPTFEWIAAVFRLRIVHTDHSGLVVLETQD